MSDMEIRLSPEDVTKYPEFPAVVKLDQLVYETPKVMLSEITEPGCSAVDNFMYVLFLKATFTEAGLSDGDANVLLYYVLKEMYGEK